MDFKEIIDRVHKVASEHWESPIVTIIGSLRFKEEMLFIHDILTSKGFQVFIPHLGKVNPSDINIIHKTHDSKMKMSDFVFCVNVGGYVGKNTKREIDFCQNIGKPVKYLCDYMRYELPTEELSDE